MLMVENIQEKEFTRAKQLEMRRDKFGRFVSEVSTKKILS